MVIRNEVGRAGDPDNIIPSPMQLLAVGRARARIARAEHCTQKKKKKASENLLQKKGSRKLRLFLLAHLQHLSGDDSG